MEINMGQVRELADRYEQGGLGGTSSGRFLRSVATEGRMPRGRGVTWLEEIITKGDPQPIGPLVTEIEDLMSRSDRDDTVSALSEILITVKSGWDFTAHKKSELERLRKQVNENRPDIEIDDQRRKLMMGLETRKRFMSRAYRASRPVISKRLDVIFTRWTRWGKVSPDDWEFVRENFKGAIAEFEGSRHPVGSLRWTRQGNPATVISEAQFDPSGSVVVEALLPSGVVKISIDGLFMRAPK